MFLPHCCRMASNCAVDRFKAEAAVQNAASVRLALVGLSHAEADEGCSGATIKTIFFQAYSDPCVDEGDLQPK